MRYASHTWKILSCVTALVLTLAVPALAEEDVPTDFDSAESTDRSLDLDFQSAGEFQSSLDESTPMVAEGAPEEPVTADGPRTLADEVEIAISDPVTGEPTYPSSQSGADGRSVSPAINEIRALEKMHQDVAWSIGFGVQHFMKNDLYFNANIERLVVPNLAIGVQGATLGTFGTPSELQGSQFLGTFNVHSARYFRGLWFQGGGGITVLKANPSVTGSSEVIVFPTIIASLGWRWGMNDSLGRDDAFSFSLAVGAQVLVGSARVGSFSATGIYPLPVLRAELNFGF